MFAMSRSGIDRWPPDETAEPTLSFMPCCPNRKARRGPGSLCGMGQRGSPARGQNDRDAYAIRIHTSVAVPQMRAPECARGGTRQSDRWRQYVQVRDVRQYLDDFARTIDLVLNATHCPEDADTSSETRCAAYDRCWVPLTFGMLLASSSVEIHMNKLVLSLPTLGFVVWTRAALGVGIGLLLSGKMTGSQRRAVGVTLVAIGVATTLPAVIAVFHNQRSTSTHDS